MGEAVRELRCELLCDLRVVGEAVRELRCELRCDLPLGEQLVLDWIKGGQSDWWMLLLQLLGLGDAGAAG